MAGIQALVGVVQRSRRHSVVRNFGLTRIASVSCSSSSTGDPPFGGSMISLVLQDLSDPALPMPEYLCILR